MTYTIEIIDTYGNEYEIQFVASSKAEAEEMAAEWLLIGETILDIHTQ